MKPMTKLLAWTLPLCGAAVFCATDASAQYPPPPPAYVASYSPVYYNGYAHYWYNNHWYYRDHGGAWRWYDHEPGYLHDRRGEWGGHHYGGWHGRR